MNTQSDFEELLKLLEENNVAYMIVGGYAVAFHGYPRFTKDIDIFFQHTPNNIKKLKLALYTFGFDKKALPDHIFIEKGNIIKFGIEPVRIDLLNEIDGVLFENIESKTERGRYGEVTVTFIGKEDLIANKKASGRTQDLADLEKLEK
jgi:predicted nucleotidyltransferase